MGANWLVGVCCALAGTVVSNFGQNLQKQSLDLFRGHLIPSYRQPRWCLGFALTFVGTIADFVALSMAAQSIIAPLTVFALISNLAFAKCMFGEVILRHHLLGTAVIVLGNTLVVVFGDHSEASYTASELVTLTGSPLFLAYMTFVCVLVAALMIARSDRIVWRCMLPGVIGAQSFLCGKIGAELLSTTLRGDNQLKTACFWATVTCLVVAIALQQRYYNGALKRFPSIRVIPLFQCIFSLCGVLGAFCLFQEYRSFSATQATVFPLGLCLVVVGVYLLCRDYSVYQQQPQTQQLESNDSIALSFSPPLPLRINNEYS